ncbi:hypothetical protein NEOLI_002227 [Neolecta irregularis DAH-3]|uniref:F-box domain-containing protein n=1 Tax=Neolecta irregularis (strain DAH-3) TaxID=1198029 RepID=A0A1U7LRB0_NEOID|nr:hypothetical protein NEOLI_002227 [Neolecta irregularis DAH-3]|eukprot:OLL25210.1 hypothetical protein NEOLI_002227 [Neolecta irregularis DAH-3]
MVKEDENLPDEKPPFEVLKLDWTSLPNNLKDPILDDLSNRDLRYLQLCCKRYRLDCLSYLKRLDAELTDSFGGRSNDEIASDLWQHMREHPGLGITIAKLYRSLKRVGRAKQAEYIQTRLLSHVQSHITLIQGIPSENVLTIISNLVSCARGNVWGNLDKMEIIGSLLNRGVPEHQCHLKEIFDTVSPSWSESDELSEEDGLSEFWECLMLRINDSSGKSQRFIKNMVDQIRHQYEEQGNLIEVDKKIPSGSTNGRAWRSSPTAN